MYYVYEWYIVNTKEVFYVGKGKGRRYKVTYDRNALFKSVLEKYECDSRIIKTFENEKDAFEYEYLHIKELKEMGFCSCNIHCGGAGGSGEYWTDELRQEYSINNPMKDDVQRKRMSEKNPMKDKNVAKRVGKQKSKPVVIGEKEYPSIKTASDELRVEPSTIVRWCNKGINAKREKCRFADETQAEFTGGRYNLQNCRSVIFRDVEYESVIDFAKAINIAENTAHSWLRRGFNPQGEECRYKDDDRNLIFENRFVKRNKKRAKAVIINGVRYSNVAEASKILDIPKTTIYSYLQKAKYNPNYICEYDNQQPSQENVDNSILEGSETNGCGTTTNNPNTSARLLSKTEDEDIVRTYEETIRNVG